MATDPSLTQSLKTLTNAAKTFATQSAGDKDFRLSPQTPGNFSRLMLQHITQHQQIHNKAKALADYHHVGGWPSATQTVENLTNSLNSFLTTHQHYIDYLGNFYTAVSTSFNNMQTQDHLA